MKIQKIPFAKGEMTVPGDKSISHRGVMLGALGEGTSEVTGFLRGADCLSTIDCFRNMGVPITLEKDTVQISGVGLHGLGKPEKTLYTGNSGTTTRLLCGLLAGQNFTAELDGDASIRKRPMARVTEPLRRMGAEFDSDFCPLRVTGHPLHAISYQMPVASAQVKTSLLLAGLYAEGTTVLTEPAVSRDHTERMLRAMGADLVSDGTTVSVTPGKTLSAERFEVPGDISSAAFFLVLGAILPHSEITVRNVGINPTRDGVIEVLKNMGADILVEHQRLAAGEPVADLTVRTSELSGCEIGGSLIPRLIDELPVLAVAAAFAKGTTRIYDAQELVVKETNRIRAVADEFRKCGIDIEETADGMIIHGGKAFNGAEFHTYGDHRMAMSLAVLAQGADGDSCLDDAACVLVSYPNFFEDLYRLGE